MKIQYFDVEIAVASERTILSMCVCVFDQLFFFTLFHNSNYTKFLCFCIFVYVCNRNTHRLYHTYLNGAAMRSGTHYVANRCVALHRVHSPSNRLNNWRKVVHRVEISDVFVALVTPALASLCTESKCHHAWVLGKQFHDESDIRLQL